MTVGRQDVPRPVRKKEVVEVDGIGEVVIQALGMADNLYISRLSVDDDEDKGASRDVQMLETLHRGVVGPDGKSLWTVDEWDAFGSTMDGLRAAMDLALKISDLAVVEKKDSPA